MLASTEVLGEPKLFDPLLLTLGVVLWYLVLQFWKRAHSHAAYNVSHKPIANKNHFAIPLCIIQDPIKIGVLYKLLFYCTNDRFRNIRLMLNKV